jgi:integrase
MARLVNILTPRGIAALLAPGEPFLRGPDGKPKAKVGVHADGQRLYLRVRPDGVSRAGQGYVAHWVFQYRWGTGKNNTQTMGLGGFPDVSLKVARDKAKAANDLLATGINPLVAKRTAPEAVPTFGDFADDWLKTLETSLTAKKNVANYKRYVTGMMAPLRDKLVSEITTQDVVATFKPLWTTQYVSAKRARSTLKRILDGAKVAGHRTGDNPAQWEGHLEHLMPAPNHKTKHREAVPYAEAPDFMTDLRAADGVSARALEFTILTAARSGEVIGDNSHDVPPMPWGEVDLKAKLWVIPGSRMKEDRDHQVPLTPRAIEILEEMQAMRWNTDPSCPVFPGMSDGEGLNSNAMLTTLKKLGRKETVHGFRSCIRDWAGNETTFARETLEEVLSHQVGNEVERAYRRGQAIEKRRALLTAWADYLSGQPSKVVVAFDRATA